MIDWSNFNFLYTDGVKTGEDQENWTEVSDAATHVSVYVSALANMVAAAGLLAPGVGWALAAFATLLAIIGLTADDIAGDPPQADYQRRAQIRPLRFEFPAPVVRDAAALVPAIRESGRCWGAMVALLDALERSAGAREAGDQHWVQVHVRDMRGFIEVIADSLAASRVAADSVLADPQSPLASTEASLSDPSSAADWVASSKAAEAIIAAGVPAEQVQRAFTAMRNLPGYGGGTIVSATHLRKGLASLGAGWSRRV